MENIPGSTVIFVIQKGSFVYGSAEIPRRGKFSIRPVGNDLHVIEQIRDIAILSGESDIRIPEDTQTKINTLAGGSVAISNDDGSIIDVYVAYDQDDSGGKVTPADAQAYAELFIAYTNHAYENSNINQRVWLVGSVDGFNHAYSNLSTTLSAATNGNISGLHGKRNEYHADLVAFFTPSAGSSCAGVA